jgi:hypothetical protein
MSADRVGGVLLASSSSVQSSVAGAFCVWRAEAGASTAVLAELCIAATSQHHGNAP